MRFIPFFIAFRLFGAAGNGATIIDNAGNVWRTNFGALIPSADAFQKTGVDTVCGTEDLSPFSGPMAFYCTHATLQKQDGAGNVLYATFLGGSSQDGGMVLTSDAQGNVYIAGYTYSSDFPVTAGAVQSKNAGPATPQFYVPLGAPFGPSDVVPGGDVFIAKFSSNGTLVFSTLLGGSGSDVPTLLAVDSAGSIYVAGVTASKDFPITANAMSNQPSGYFFSRLNATGTKLLYSAYLPSPVYAFDIDNQGHAYLTGGNNGAPYVTELDTSAGTVVFSQLLASLKSGLAGSGTAIALAPDSNLMLAVSPTPVPYSFTTGNTAVLIQGASYLFQLSANAGAILAETDVNPAVFNSILFDADGNAYAFGNGTGAIPATPIQLLAAPCLEYAASFVLETNPAGTVTVASYFRQATDSAVAIAAPGKIPLYLSAPGKTMTMDISQQPAALFGCPANLASDVVGLSPGEIFIITGTGIGPAQGIAGVPDATGMYPTSLGGFRVLFGSTPAPLLYMQANEIHAVAPYTFGPVTISVQNGTQTVSPLDTSIAEWNPGIFSINGQGAIINDDGTVNTPANPAKLGTYVSVYSTGMGNLLYPATYGAVTAIPPPYDPIELVYYSMTFAGVPGNVLWAGAAPEIIGGVTQVNVTLPASLPAGTNLSAVPVVLNADNVSSPPVNISVKR